MSASQKQGVHLVALGVTYFVIFLIAAGVGANKGLFHFPEPGPGFGRKIATDIAFSVLMALMVCGLTYILVQKIESLRALSRLFYEFFGPLTGAEIFFISAFSALGEEFLFRGVIQHYLGLGFTSILFGLLHTGPDRRFVPWSLFGIAAGFMLGGLYQWLWDLLAPVAAHFVINFVNLHMLMKQDKASQGAGSS